MQAGMTYTQKEDYNKTRRMPCRREGDYNEQAGMLVCSQEKGYNEQAGMLVTHKSTAPGIVVLPSTRGKIQKTEDAASGRPR